LFALCNPKAIVIARSKATKQSQFIEIATAFGLAMAKMKNRHAMTEKEVSLRLSHEALAKWEGGKRRSNLMGNLPSLRAIIMTAN
jgi:hypothetical protein